MNGILLPRKYLNFPLVKVIVSKIAYEFIKNTKNDHFLMDHYRKLVREFFIRIFGNIILVIMIINWGRRPPPAPKMLGYVM